MAIVERNLAVVCDGFRLPGGALVPERPRGMVVLFHGIPSTAPPEPGDEGYRGFARRFCERGFVAVWAAFRAAHGTPGFFSIEGWVRDARAIVDCARALEGAGGLPLALVGSSAGGAVAVEAAARGASADALVLLAAPAEWLSFARDPFAGVSRITVGTGMQVAPEVHQDPTAWGEEFERVVPERAMALLTRPVLVVHGTADDVVPVDHAERLAARSSMADLRILEGAGHRLRLDDSAVTLVLDWLERTL